MQYIITFSAVIIGFLFALLLKPQKKKNIKLKHQKITVKEFCRDQGLELQDVIQELKEFYKR